MIDRNTVLNSIRCKSCRRVGDNNSTATETEVQFRCKACGYRWTELIRA